MVPTHINNVFAWRMNSLNNNASVSYGNTLHKGHQANAKQNTGYWQTGDAYVSPLQFNNMNLSNDPDLLDTPQAQV